MESWQSKLIKIILRLKRNKRKVRYVQELIENGFENERLNDKPSSKVYEKHLVSTREYRGRTVWTVAPREKRSEKHILYLHGGGYVNGFAWLHWSFISNLVSRLGCTVIAPDYPLTPENQVHNVFDMVFPIYQELLTKVGAENLIVMGDSAGGGIGLALAMRARDEKIEQPSEIVLLSPWLDVTMTNTDAEKIDRFDPFLDIRGLKYLGKIYAGETDPTDYLVSPIYGSLKNLAPITLFIGTHDLFVADCRKFKNKAEAEGIKIDYHEYERMVHVWMLMSLPEGKKAAKAICAKIEKQ
ncbi:MAG TPA: alpha/beta hydrolase [Pyrinomonadaceae bacterium]|nr:alpha/beta hydrolase [Pyrinomonadaceae bacterium]